MTSGETTLTYEYYTGTDNLEDIKNGENTVSAYTYDLSGNEITRTVEDTVTTYAYNPANLLTAVTEQVGQGDPATLAFFDYNASNQRTQKIAGTDETNYFYGGINLLYTTDDNEDMIEENVLEPDGSIVQSRRADESDYWYRQDVRGSVTNIVDDADAAVKSYAYDAYGNTTESGTFTNSFAYTGAVIDTETGLYYMNARYYDPATGRFISADTYRGDGELYWNLYIYCNDDPINCTDITGHAPYQTIYRKKVYKCWIAPLVGKYELSASVRFLVFRNNTKKWYVNISEISAFMGIYNGNYSPDGINVNGSISYVQLVYGSKVLTYRKLKMILTWSLDMCIIKLEEYMYVLLYLLNAV